MTEAIDLTQGTSVNQADYLKLFMQELTYQDPLKPVDNREFMAQMAQFSALQEAQSASNSLNQLVSLGHDNKSLMLLGKTVSIRGSALIGTVNKIEFTTNSIPIIHVLTENESLTLSLEDITSVS